MYFSEDFKVIIKRLLAGIMTVLLLGVFVAPVHAGASSVDVFSEICNNPNISDEVKNATPACKDSTPDNPLLGENGFISKLIRIFSLATAVAAVITIIIGGFMFVSSQGDSSGINNAKTTLTYAVVGLVVAALAQVIVVFVVDKL